MTRCLLISTYEMGRQPFGLASAAAFLRAAGATVRCVDTAKQRLEPRAFEAADLIGFHLPMHTALNLGHIALKVGRKLHFDAKKWEIAGDPEANRMIMPEYRPPWKLPV